VHVDVGTLALETRAPLTRRKIDTNK
jgi:hypothetical protein